MPEHFSNQSSRSRLSTQNDPPVDPLVDHCADYSLQRQRQKGQAPSLQSPFRAIPGAFVFVFSAIFLLNSTCRAESEHPNVLIVMTDDQGYGDLSLHGNPHLQTPNLDDFAHSGAQFERFFVSPVCAPTRASLLTGRDHLRTGVSGVTRGFENVRGEEVTIAELFRDAGYRTGCFGKWHNGRHMPMHPNGQGFETFIGFCAGHWNSYFDPPLEHNGEEIQGKGYIIDYLTDEAIEFIRTDKDKPWLCYVAYNTPHSPWRVADEYWNRFNGMGLDTKAQCAYAMVANIDENFGRLIEALDQNTAKETIVLFLTDNGANSDRFNAGMKGRKASIDEGGSRVPLFIRYPQAISSGTIVKPIASHLDLLPTLAEFCSVKIPEDVRERLDGTSLVPLLTNANAPSEWPNRTIFTDMYRTTRPDHFRAAVRTDQWRATIQGDSADPQRWELYDMVSDPGQQKNVAAFHPEVVTELRDTYLKWRSTIDLDSLDDVRIPVGHPSRNAYRLPANEAFLRPEVGEGIRYTGDTAAGYANSWITDWTNTDAFPEWTIEVTEAGRYSLSLEYTCPREIVGSQLRLEIGDQATSVNIPKAFDPPLVPKPDHLFSTNYQDKSAWATLEIDEYELEAGVYPVRVRINSLAGERGIDLRSLTLTRARNSN
ncbi:Arylsulfatase [Thalassoglobus neptunius]|uniref:Arylsulfatase n=2 Tax=Thalassoglobus neptunius TaxID=1938619 RepID=A0A5C5WZP4_9PLAN|nr:Arylsulfatase [Thalassoglobus neptunius]